ncbi:MAG: OsmC family protein [Calditrichaceae bacterium]|nr:OsmC family protein [Calditrichaceae bacterium]MBN2709668.1 OsmC family protein [Calditrichaceae bacterium]RQV95027.1 MAG: OsmC family peroxiredoxin [Calditrichota bacterium]
MAKVSAKVIQISGVTFNGLTESKHWVAMDGPEEFGGSDGAIRPKELLLLSLAGCTGSDVASILTKMRERYTRLEVHLDGEMAEEHPKVYTSLHLKFKIWGDDLNTSNIEKAISLSSGKYCSVTAMLRNSVKITDSYEINPEE